MRTSGLVSSFMRSGCASFSLLWPSGVLKNCTARTSKRFLSSLEEPSTARIHLTELSRKTRKNITDRKPWKASYLQLWRDIIEPQNGVSTKRMTLKFHKSHTSSGERQTWQDAAFLRELSRTENCVMVNLWNFMCVEFVDISGKCQETCFSGNTPNKTLNIALNKTP